MTPEERNRLLARAATLQDADLADALLAHGARSAALLRSMLEALTAEADAIMDAAAMSAQFLAWQEGTEGDTLNEPMPAGATVDTDRLLEIWAAIDRCATVAADTLASEYERTTDFRPNRAGLRARFAEEIWLSVSDAVSWARGDILDGLA